MFPAIYTVTEGIQSKRNLKKLSHGSSKEKFSQSYERALSPGLCFCLFIASKAARGTIRQGEEMIM